MDSQQANSSAESGDYLEVLSSEGMDFRLEIAGLGARCHAFLIDWHIRLLLAIAWLVIVGLLTSKLGELREIAKLKSSSTLLLLLLPAAAIYFLYHPLLEILLAGRSPGKRMAGVRLVTINGHSPGVGALLLRNLFRLIDCLPGLYLLGLVCVACTRRKVRIGDLAAGLVLVYDNGVNPKTMLRITDLALNSGLNRERQGLLLDLLDRWPELAQERRIAFAEQFLQSIGQPLPEESKPRRRDKLLKQMLESLLNTSAGPN